MKNTLNAIAQSVHNLPAMLESGAVDWVARVAPWLAPLPTAYLVYARTTEYLRWPEWVGLSAAIVIECLGLATVSTGLMLREYAAQKRKSDPAAPTRLAYSLIAIYLLVAELLTVFLDLSVHPWADWRVVMIAPALFPLLSLAGMAVLAIRGDHARRVAAIAECKAEAATKRAARRKQKAESAAKGAAMPPVTPATPEERGGNGHQPMARGEFFRQYPDPRGMTGRQIAEIAGVSARTGRDWLSKWRDGRISDEPADTTTA